MFSNHKSQKYIFTQRDLNMRQHRWMKYLEDYEFNLYYHPDKENVVVDALRLKSRGVLANVALRSGKCLSIWDSLGCSTVNRLKER